MCHFWENFNVYNVNRIGTKTLMKQTVDGNDNHKVYNEPLINFKL